MQNSRWKTPLLLTGVLAVAGGLAWYLETVYTPKKKDQEELKKKIFQLKDIPVTKMDLLGGEKTFRFECLDLDKKLCKPGDQSTWDVLEPRKVKGDRSNINSLLTSIKNLSPSDTVDLTSETPEKRESLLQQYGLGKDLIEGGKLRRIELTLADPSDKKKTETQAILYLGDTHPIGDGIFAIKKSEGKLQTDQVYIVYSHTKNHFDRELDYWRDKKLFSVASNQITHFTLQSPQFKTGVLKAERKEGQWTLTPSGSGEPLEGDAENIDSFLTATLNISAKSIPVETAFTSPERKTLTTESKKVLGKAKPVITLSLATPENVQFQVYATFPSSKKTLKDDSDLQPEQLFATVSNLDMLFELETNIWNRLNKNLKDFRLAKVLTPMERFTVKRIEVSGPAWGATPFILVSKDGKWKEENPSDPKKELSQSKVQDLLEKISGNRIKDFLEPKAAPKGDGMILTLGDEKKSDLRKLKFWKSGEKLYAQDLEPKNPGRAEVFVMDTMLNRYLPFEKGHFEEKKEESAKDKKGNTKSAAGLESPDLKAALESGSLAPELPEGGEEDTHDHGDSHEDHSLENHSEDDGHGH